MRRIDHIAVNDIIRKRQIRTAKSLKNQQQISQLSLMPINKQTSFQQVVQKIQKNQNKNVHECQLTLQQKYVLIQFMSEKQQNSYNRNTLVSLMTVWKCPGTIVMDNQQASSSFFHKKQLKNFFLVSGRVCLFNKQEIYKKYIKSSANQNQQQNLTFQTQSKPDISTLIEGVTPCFQIQEHSGWGALFDKKQQHNLKYIFKFQNVIIIQLKAPELQGMLVNLGGMDQQKKIKIIQQFPIFSKIGKTILSILPHIELKKYGKNQFIYRIKQRPSAIYLILRGQVVFQVKIQLPKQRKFALGKSLPAQIVVQTQTLGLGSYFGEQQIIYENDRTLNSICHSADCDLLQIPIQKFERLLANSDFYEQLKKAADVKINKRKQKIQKALTIYLQFNKSPEMSLQKSQTLDDKQSNNTPEFKRLSLRKRSSQPVRMMHGNLIRKIPVINNDEPVNFSMLGANPDMYQATLKKFRKYSMRPAQKTKPQVNWNLKRVWKVLKLQNILSEDSQISSPQGRKFYDSHRRLQNHVQQVKSLRPKTSSSTYRTKLQYIAYLQQFSN